MSTSRFLPALLVAVLTWCCNKAPKGNEAKISEREQTVEETGQILSVDTVRSYVKFNDRGKGRPGICKVSYGTVSLKNDSVSGGTFLVDIHSMALEQRGNKMPEPVKVPLMNGDTLDARDFGPARFEVTNVVPYTPEEGSEPLTKGANLYVSGNFRLKEVTKNISFPVRVDLDGETLKAKASFTIDRTQWKENYGSDLTLDDQFAPEIVNIELYVEARPQENTTL